MEKDIKLPPISKKEEEKKKRKKELLRILIILLLSNLITFFIASSSSEEIENEEFYEGREDFERIKIEGKNFVPFEYLKRVKVVNDKDLLICKEVLLLSREEADSSSDFLSDGPDLKESFIVEAPKDCLKLLLKTKNIKIVPETFLTQTKKETRAYEVFY